MNTILKKQDRKYGGYDYIEFNTDLEVFQTGNSRAHRGHFKGNAIVVNVTTKKELKQVQEYLESQDYRDCSWGCVHANNETKHVGGGESIVYCHDCGETL